MSETSPASPPHDPYAALRERDFRLFLCGSLMAFIGIQMQTLAVEWEAYNRTGRYLSLAYIGLLNFAPVFFLALPAGFLADHLERRRIVIAGNLTMLLASLGLAAVVFWKGPNWLLYALVLLGGTGRAVQQPARAALMPQIVPRHIFSNAVTWSGGGFQLASVLGPALGGFVIGLAHTTAPAFLLAALGTGTFASLALLLRPRSAPRRLELPTACSRLGWLRELGWLIAAPMFEGVGFIWRARIILATITLDLFAVLLGGAVGLLPVYAKDILNIGATGLGWLRAMPFLGALLVSLIIAHRPPMQKAGRALLWSVAGFGLATIVFGFSRSVALSLVMLFVVGAFDMVSVVVRHTLVQTLTPDEMRGRVSAVNGMFIGASNELGVFESGTVAHYIGPTWSVVTGGIGTILVVAGVAWLFPGVRRYGRLDSAPEPRQSPSGGFPVLDPTPTEKPAAP